MKKMTSFVMVVKQPHMLKIHLDCHLFLLLFIQNDITSLSLLSSMMLHIQVDTVLQTVCCDFNPLSSKEEYFCVVPAPRSLLVPFIQT